MANVRALVENKSTLDYDALCTALVEQFGVTDKINFESVLPAPQQQELFGGEILRSVAEHPQFTNQKDIRILNLKKGSLSQMLFLFLRLNDGELSKASIQRITTRFIRGSDANRYIVWFFGNKDETELKVVLSGKEGKKVVMKTLPFGVNQPYYKTYTFILAEVQAKLNQFFVEPTDLWKTLWKAFDISIINRNFYNEIKDAFERLLTQLNKKGNPFKTDEDRVQFAIRLIGRIIFCWFLKRKEVLKDDALSSQAVKEQDKKNYYQDLLEILFFDVLNTPEKERKGGIPKVIAHYPFLNGGLFEAQETDYQNNLQLNIENDWFEKFFGNTLEKYNFTVDENSSSNEEIAIDPEMLGRIFENLLAEQNPETGESARKATGSFYTPREIVDYMVEQSITEYLKTSLSLNTENEAIEDFVHTFQSDKIEKHSKEIIAALNKIKVLDPACGSGAFPIGILQKVVALKHQLQPKANLYKLKLDTIQNSIYGVDIQPMAVELSRLRCWLSLVVDEEQNDIKALPNLDFKFVCADSLMDVPATEYVTDDLEKNLKELEEKVEQYFSPDFKSKKKIKAGIKENIAAISKFHHNVIARLITKIRQEEKTASPAKLKLLREKMMEYFDMDAKWNSYDNIFNNKKVEFFNPVFFFPSAKRGFDIVIANPPYGADLTKEAKEYFNKTYKHQEYQLDSYLLFIERGVQLLKKDGTISYIIPNPWLTNLKLKKFRKFIVDENTVVNISHYSKYLFNAIVDTEVVVFKKHLPNGNSVRIDYYEEETPQTHVIQQAKWQALNGDPINIFIDANSQFVIDKLKVGSLTISKVCDVVVGMKPYQVGKGNPKQTREIVTNRKFDAEYEVDSSYLKLLRGKDIDRYEQKWNGKRWIKFGDWLAEPRYSAKFDNPEKIVLRQTGDTIIATIDTEKFVCMNNMHVINQLDKSYSLKFILAILNSKLTDFYYECLNPEKGEALAEVKKENVERLLIKECSPAIQKPFIFLVDYILLTKSITSNLNEYVPNEHIAKLFEELIDACVYELYFPEEVKDKEAVVLKLVSEQFIPIEGLSMPEQIEIVKQGYQILRVSNTEIRNRITRQKLVNEIAIINRSVQ